MFGTELEVNSNYNFDKFRFNIIANIIEKVYLLEAEQRDKMTKLSFSLISSVSSWSSIRQSWQEFGEVWKKILAFIQNVWQPISRSKTLSTLKINERRLPSRKRKQTNLILYLFDFFTVSCKKLCRSSGRQKLWTPRAVSKVTEPLNRKVQPSYTSMVPILVQ